MKLADYLDRHECTATAFAKRIGRSHTTVTRILRGETRPDWETMAAIERETGGEVTPNDFRSEAAA